MKITKYGFSTVSPSSLKKTASLALFVALFALISRFIPLPLSSHPELIYLGAGLTILGLAKLTQVYSINKIIFGILATFTLATALTLTGVIPSIHENSFWPIFGGGLSGLLATALIYWKGKTNITKLVDQIVANAHLDKKQHIYLREPYEYSMLHYELAKRTENASKKKTKESWKTTLTQMNKNVIVHFVDHPCQFTLDCSHEIRRLEGNKIELEVVELTHQQIKENPQLLKQIQLAQQESFGSDNTEDCLKILGARLFVARDKTNPDVIYGGLFVQSQEDGSYYIHTLMKRAFATKINLTNTIKEFLINGPYKEKGGDVYCEVAWGNFVAKNIYETLKFKKQSFAFLPVPHYKMKLIRTPVT